MATTDWLLVKTGRKGELARTGQYLLRHRGFNIAAVRDLQKSQNLQVDGIIGNQTWPKLIVQIQQGSKSHAVRAAQAQLGLRNLPETKNLAVDGDLGALTHAGVRAFHKCPERPQLRSYAGRRHRRPTHLVIQIGLFVVVALLVVDLAAALAHGTAFFALTALLLGLAGAVVGSLASALYLALWCAFGRAHCNEAFSAVSYGRYKNFLRMHIGTDRSLTIYPLGVDRVNTAWEFDPDAATTGAPWIKPRGDKLAARLIESPIKIPGAP